MVDVTIEGDRAVFQVEHGDRFWAFRSRLEVPLAHLKAVRADPTVTMGWFDRITLGGTYLPGVIAAGTFYQKGGLVFWDVKDPSKALVIDLHDETYHQLVIEVADPAATETLLSPRLAGTTGRTAED